MCSWPGRGRVFTSVSLDHVYRLRRGCFTSICLFAGLPAHSYGFTEVMAQQEKVCGAPLWSSALITLPHNCSSPLTTIRPGRVWERSEELSLLLETHEVIDQVAVVALTPGVWGTGRGPAAAQVDVCLRWHLEDGRGIVSHRGTTDKCTSSSSYHQHQSVNLYFGNTLD